MKIKNLCLLLVLAIGTGICGQLLADPADDPAAGSESPNGGESRVVEEHSGYFGDDTGNVVEGLRNAEPFEYQGETINVPEGSKAMGVGNVDHTLDLAKFQLEQQGITDPTASQLDTALNGGQLIDPNTGQPVETNGILQMRADGMGWGEIAHEYDTKLGWIKSGKAPPSQATETTTTAEGGEADTSGTATAASTHPGKGRALGKGIVSGSGATTGSTTGNGSKGKALGKGIVSGSGELAGSTAGNNGKALGKGIVSGSGSVSGGGTVSRGHGKALGRGIVSGLGGPAGGGVVSSGHGNAHGHGVTSGLGNSGSSSGHGKALGHSK